MGNAMTGGENNDDLVDSLISEYIKSKRVENILRAVDRGAYFPPEPRVNPYRDVAWKSGNIHLSAPCIYGTVLEKLELKPSLSFLNIGSGTGYLNTLVGLVLGRYGVNHGIEIHEDVIQYAERKLEEFKRRSGAVDVFDFCEPQFVNGNFLNVKSSNNMYDRVYCGAGCPERYLPVLEGFVKVGGILIVPVLDQLLQLKRISENKWNRDVLLSVSFAHLAIPEDDEKDVDLPIIESPSLLMLCRAYIRDLLQEIIDSEHPEMRLRENVHDGRKKRKPSKRERRGPDVKIIKRTKEERRNEQPINQIVIAVRGEAPDREFTLSDSDNNIEVESMQDVFMDILATYSRPFCVRRVSEEASTSRQAMEEEKKDESTSSNQTEDDEMATEDCDETSEASTSKSSNESNHRNHIEVEAVVEAPKKTDQTFTEDKSRKSSKTKDRIKFDSGLGDEVIDDIESVTSSDDEKDTKRKCKTNLKFRKVDSDKESSESEIEVEDDPIEKMNVYHQSINTAYLGNKIKELPLPFILRSYVHYYKEF